MNREMDSHRFATDLAGVLKLMRESAIPEEQTVWTERWVKSLYRFCKGRGPANREAGIRFLKELRDQAAPGEKMGLQRYEHAKEALGWYFRLTGQAAPLAGNERKEIEPVEKPSPGRARPDRLTWKEAGERFRQYLVRRHYAERTVETYLGWARQFWAR